MSDRDLYLSSGNPWTYGLSALLCCVAFVALLWVALHAGPYLLACWRRGRAYRQATRRARHRRTSSLHHLRFRSPIVRTDVDILGRKLAEADRNLRIIAQRPASIRGASTVIDIKGSQPKTSAVVRDPATAAWDMVVAELAQAGVEQGKQIAARLRSGFGQSGETK